MVLKHMGKTEILEVLHCIVQCFSFKIPIIHSSLKHFFWWISILSFMWQWGLRTLTSISAFGSQEAQSKVLYSVADFLADLWGAVWDGETARALGLEDGNWGTLGPFFLWLDKLSLSPLTCRKGVRTMRIPILQEHWDNVLKLLYKLPKKKKIPWKLVISSTGFLTWLFPFPTSQYLHLIF